MKNTGRTTLRPQTPNKIDRRQLSGEQRKRLSGLIDAISSVNPGRRAELNLNQAIRAFKITVRPRKNGWEDLPNFRLDNGKGPVVVPSYMKKNDVL